MNRKRFGLLDTIESIPLETKKRLRKKYNSDEQGDKKYVETTYSELKSLRDEGKLIPGALYRITDYQCTTVQEGTRSAGHQFDIIVQALSESVLSEDARAINHKYENKFISITHDGETIPYMDSKYITFNDNVRLLVHRFFDDVNNQYWVNDKDLEHCLAGVAVVEYEEVDNEIVAQYDSYHLSDKSCTAEYSDYFHSCNLAAWKLKYCFDNDDERFAWAQSAVVDGVNTMIVENGKTYGSDIYGILKRCPSFDNGNHNSDYKYAWGTDDDLDDEDNVDFVYSKNPIVQPGELVFNAYESKYQNVISFSGKGVIYQMIDEYNNDCPYDFKNIQFLRSQQWLQKYEKWTNKVNDDHFIDSYYYTFSIYTATSPDTYLVYDASIQNESIYLGWNKVFNNKIRPYIDDFSSTTLNKQILNNIIIASYLTDDLEFSVYNNTFNNNCHNISCVNSFFNNTFENSCENIIFSKGVSNTILQNESNTINVDVKINNSVFKYNRNITITTTNDIWSISYTTIDSTVKDCDIVISSEASHSYIYRDSGDQIFIDRIYTAFDRT